MREGANGAEIFEATDSLDMLVDDMLGTPVEALVYMCDEDKKWAVIVDDSDGFEYDIEGFESIEAAKSWLFPLNIPIKVET